ncbi:MAG: OmpA family protein [Desulfobacterales bacterium]|nr:OmpA family protein [Desulfobacterales bacterium]
MIAKTFKQLLVFILGLMMVGCAARAPVQEAPFFEPFGLNSKIQSGAFVQKVDNYLIILDASQSMSTAYKYKDYSKFTFTKEIIRRMNQALPDLKINGALRTFGHGACLPKELTLLINPLDTHTKSRLDAGLEKVSCAGGTSPIREAVQAVEEDLSQAQGSTALIIFSDGKDMNETPVAAAKRIKGRFGDKLCIYTVLVGDDPAGQILMEKIATAGECGFSLNAEDIATGQGMANFVERVFLKEGKDSDGDGIMDKLDRCPGTPKGVTVDSNGCPVDSDGDGISDDLDRCPNTPAGVRVDRYGCPLVIDTDGDGVSDALDQCPDTPRGAAVHDVGCWVCNPVQFEFDKWKITPQHYDALEGLLRCLKQSPSLTFEVQGHTCNIGTGPYNQTLSEKRARSVMEYLVIKGVEKDRLMIRGYGLTQPIDSNETREGRSKNRRVQLKPID